MSSPAPIHLAAGLRITFAPGPAAVLHGSVADAELPVSVWRELAFAVDSRRSVETLVCELGIADAMPALLEAGVLTLDPAVTASRGVGALPAQLGHYRLVAHLGAGSFGDVYEAIDLDRRGRVAVKVLRSVEPGSLQGFKNEVRVVADLSDPRLVTPFDLLEEEGRWFLSMEIIDGQEPLSWIRPVPGAPADHHTWERARSVLYESADALGTLHQAGVLHLDVKPSNLLVRTSGEVAVLDFGLSQLARRGASTPGHSPSGGGGTPIYIAPELLNGDAPGEMCDAYSLGMVLYEAISTVRPFDELEEFDLYARCEEPAAPLAQHAPGIPEDLASLIDGLLRTEPSERVEAWTAARRPSTPAPSTPGIGFVGRKAQLAGLEAAWRRVHDDRAEVVFVTGAPGIGKSSLIQHFCDRLTGPAVLRGRCYERETIPFKGFDAVVDHLRAEVAHDPRLLTHNTTSDERAALALMFPVLAEEGAELALPPGGPQEIRRHAFRALRALLEALGADRGVVVAIDDVQWADSDTVHLLAELLAPPHASGLLLLLSCRADGRVDSPFGEAWADATRRGMGWRVTDLPLAPLEIHERLEMARALLGEDASEEALASLADRTMGSPFFLQALAGEDVSDGAAPTLEALLERQMRRLDKRERDVVELAAVAGHPIAQGALLDAAGVGSEGRRLLTRLRSAKLLRGRGAGAHDGVEPYHDTVGDWIRSSMARPRRVTLHLALAQNLASWGAAPAQLARHWFEGGERLRAAELARVAGDQAATTLAFEAAARHYADAIAWGDDDGSELHRAHGEALYNSGRCAESSSAFLAAARTAPSADAGGLRRRAAEAMLVAGRIDEGLDLVHPLLTAHGIPHPLTSATTMFSLLWGLIRLVFTTPVVPKNPRTPEPADAERMDLAWDVGKGLIFVHPLPGVATMLRSHHDALRVGDVHRIGRSAAFLGGFVLMQLRPMRARGTRWVALSKALGVHDPYLRGVADLWAGMG